MIMSNINIVHYEGETVDRTCQCCYQTGRNVLVFIYGGASHTLCFYCMKQFLKVLSIKMDDIKEHQDIDRVSHLWDTLKYLSESMGGENDD